MNEGYQSRIPGVTIKVKPAAGPSCPRCRFHDENIGKPGHHFELCDRCYNVLHNEKASIKSLAMTNGCSVDEIEQFYRDKQLN